MYISVPVITILLLVLFGLLSRLGKYKAALSQLYTALEIVNQATHFTDQAQRIAEALDDKGKIPPVSLTEATQFTQGFLAQSEPFTSSTDINANYTKEYYQQYSDVMHKEQSKYTRTYTQALLDALHRVTSHS